MFDGQPASSRSREDGRWLFLFFTRSMRRRSAPQWHTL
jgi:hypothetical protein